MGVFFCPSLEFINIHTRWQNFVYINMLKLKIHPVFIALLLLMKPPLPRLEAFMKITYPV